ncbi:MAG: protein translocase subunit SecD [Planctomycetes bacterium]|nr:protein translocase subunit SecD [Planctomycetota bacterium]
MNKNQIWKLVFIVALVLIAIYQVTPLDKKLKPGLDLGGGVSLIYDIDTEGLTNDEIKNLAQRIIPILRRRIDPTNVANIVMIPHGDTRIEIQMPLASKGTVKKRDLYQKALESLEDENINLLKTRRTLSKEGINLEEEIAKFAGDPAKRAELVSEIEKKKEQLDDNKVQDELEAEIADLEAVVAEFDKRREILKKWADVNIKRNAMQKQRDQLDTKMAELTVKLEEANLAGVERMAPDWNKLDSEKLAEAIEGYANDDTDKIALINGYMAIFKERAPIVNELAKPVTGLTAQYRAASAELAQLNLAQGQVMDTLALGATSGRQAKIEKIIKAFPGRKAMIVAAADAYDAYKEVGGRLDDPEDLKRMLKGAGVLEFRILPLMPENPTEFGALKIDLTEKGPGQISMSKYVWLEVENPDEFKGSYQKGMAVVETFGEKTYVLASNQKGETMLQGSGQKKWKMKKATPTVDHQTGKRAISFRNDEVAAKLFFSLTSANLGRPLCIVLDDQAISAPVLNSERGISKVGIITGNFSQQEVNDMVNKLNAGSFPARMSDVPISEKSIGATIGVENRKQGTKAGIYGMIAVAAFMVVYYLLAGIVAVLALCMNLLFILALMVILDGTFTLPGIAGLILTIGMSVDANVLIFERIREEIARGGSLRSAVANGYQRAFRTIFDANITTFGVALILYMVASEEIKGFAIILMLGIASSMFTALFATRVIFDTLMDLKVLKNKLTMQSLIKKPNINWMSARGIFFSISAILILGGLTIFTLRDDSENSKWDIEFTGGTRFTVDIKGDKLISEDWVKERIRNKGIELNNASLVNAKVNRVGKKEDYQFEITTTATNKTTANVTFAKSGQTVESVKADVKKAANDFRGTLYKLEVAATSDDGLAFEVSTSQVNKALVRKVLAAAFKDKADVSEPVVDELVSNAVREAFEGYLKIKENLGAAITSVDKVDETTVDLLDYIGGIKITCELEKETTYKDLVERFKAIQFKGDMQTLAWYTYDILTTDLAKLGDDDTVKSFVFTSVHPDAGYRQFSDEEWTTFEENEKKKIMEAASLETTLSRVTQIDPSVGKEAMYSALIAIILSLIAIVAYIWIRFGTANFGFAAIAALVHDVCIVLGLVTACSWISTTSIGKALLIQDFKIDLAMIAAFLTIIGYSLNDTIVVFDRIRENKGKQIKLTKEILNNSVNQTLSRTLLTSLTTFMVVLIMYIWGGPGLRGFTFAMLIGIIVGTYSSIAIAAPILLIGSKKKD